MTTTSHINHILPSSMRAVIVASSYWILSISLTSPIGSGAAFLGCLISCLVVDALSQKPSLQRLRYSSIAMFALGLLVCGLLFSQAISSFPLFAALLGPIAAYETGEAVRWALIAFAFTIMLRSLAHRTSYGRVVEIVFVAAAFVITLAAHRQGMIHRPFFIGDFALSRGIDPSSILMALGCVAVLSLAGLLIAEGNHRRLPYHFTLLGLLCFSLLIYVRLYGLPTPALTDGMGLTGQSEESRSSKDDNPFKDSENETSDKQSPVAVVLFRDDYEPAEGMYYFRESAYTEFNGSMLAITDRQDLDIDLIRRFTPSRAEIAEPLPAQHLRKNVRTTIGLLAPHKSPFGLDSPVAYENTPNPNSLRFKRTYDAYSMVPEYEFPDLIGRSSGHPDWNQEQRESYLELPDDPRYQKLAKDIVAELRPEFADDPYAKALAIKNYLDQNGIYSLKNEHAYATDPAASFLFGDLTGYCVHFSFAATYMLRSIGIPSRVGLGYLVPAQNRAGGSSLLIQAINGHAWPEIYLEGIGWVIVDPSPAQTLVDMSVAPQNDLQQLLGDMLRDEASFEEFLSEQGSSSFPFAMVARAIASILLALVLLAYAVKIYRLRIPYWSKGSNTQRLMYRASLDTLSSLGITRRYGESREQFARRVGSLSPSFAALSNQHIAYALAQKDSYELASNELTLGQNIRLELKRLPIWRRAIAILNPFSWLRTH
ncbi:MAG: transglutaminase domain-containing protein [Pseudohongiellaceae bacterium]|nr:transglutaminase domain-containing protein [Pseudohongiellaceae bacterium]